MKTTDCVSRTLQLPIQVIMEVSDSRHIHKERVQLSSIECCCHRKNGSNLETFFLIFQKKQTRKPNKIPMYINTDSRYSFFVYLFAKAGTNK